MLGKILGAISFICGFIVTFIYMEGYLDDRDIDGGKSLAIRAVAGALVGAVCTVIVLYL